MRILAINPWIYDFAAYDFWLKPYGFLSILSYLKTKQNRIDFIDCLDKKISKDPFGRGKYYSERIAKPKLLESVPRYFKRYGKTIAEVESEIKKTKPDFILITSSMTYWYPAISEVIKILKTHHPGTPIILGGTYATLCHSHAESIIGCDYLFENRKLNGFFELFNIGYEPKELFSTLPRYEDFYHKLDYVVLRTSWGCPFSCSYCAINELSDGFFRISQEKVIKFILKYCRKGIGDFVFYDDALLYENKYIKSLLRKILEAKINVRFHTPNALHLRFLDEETASLLKRTGFTNPHFGLETLNPSLQKKWGDKVNLSEVEKGVKTLKKAGFKNGEFSLYLLLGYPDQDLEELKKEIDFLNSQGARVSLAEFAITPKTKIFKDYENMFADPLLHNNSIFFSSRPQALKEFYWIKDYTRQLNKKLSAGQ
ncbi:MAG: radical SAM protein [Candidatus Omnitrophica bacterium]|nr:radical SAM protein [Candidatus Omnitrophota bacterium]